jgi:hypothetical protein
MSILTPPIQPLWVPRRRVISPYKHTCPQCGKEWGKRSVWERLRLAMGANGEIDLDDAGNQLIDDDGNLQICEDCCVCFLETASAVVNLTVSGSDCASSALFGTHDYALEQQISGFALEVDGYSISASYNGSGVWDTAVSTDVYECANGGFGYPILGDCCGSTVWWSYQGDIYTLRWNSLTIIDNDCP